MSDDRTLGQIIDGFNVGLDIEDNQQITDVIVLAKVLDMDNGEITLISRWSPTMSWIERRGILRVAEQSEFSVDVTEEDD